MKLGIKAIVAKDPFHIAKQVKAIENALTGTASAIRVDHKVTVQTFTHKPTFVIDSRPYERDIYTTDPIYKYLNDGTPPHIIRPRNKPALAFQSGHKRKTMPNVIASRPGGKFGPTVFTKKEIKHPGTQATNFTRVIAKKWNREAPRNLQRAIAAANS